MPHLRSAWKGYLKIGLVTFPVQAYVGSSGGDNPPIRFNQLHKSCHSRIKYVKTCPIHGEVPNEEIVSGYEYEKGQYVEIDPDELKDLRAEGERAITVDSFVKPDAVDPAYLAGKTYFVLPDGQIAERPYQLVCEAMEKEGLNAVARMLITTREHVVRLRPQEGVLTVDLLEYAAQVRSPADFKEGLVDTHPPAQEQKLTRQLMLSMTQKKLDLSKYADEYTNRVREIIDAKIQGREVVTPGPAAEPHVVNLMDALKQSMAQTRAVERPARQKAPSVTKRPAEAKKQPSGRKKLG
jgi:DNA end-binding protein Ku